MKISPSDYAELKADIKAVCEAYGIDLATADGGTTGLKAVYAVHTLANQNRAYDDTHPGFASGKWRRVLPYTGRDYCHLYDKGLNDDHVHTALKRIKAELTLGRAF